MEVVPAVLERCCYCDPIAAFLGKGSDSILGALAAKNSFSLEQSQRDAWLEEIRILQSVLAPYRDHGKVYFEYSIPRLGKRIDAVALIGPVVFVLEFKVGETEFATHAMDQVWDYALDLKNFHESSHDCTIVPILIATTAADPTPVVSWTQHNDKLLRPIRSSTETLPEVIRQVLKIVEAPAITADQWEQGGTQRPRGRRAVCGVVTGAGIPGFGPPGSSWAAVRLASGLR